jgi:3-(3-hydroxy-phenyl)propionate hydroxylase
MNTTGPDDDSRYDVIICGYGPVGAVLANLLGQRGLRVAVFERAADVYHMPRAAHFDHEIMRTFQGIGLTDEILPATARIEGMHFLNADGRKLFGFDSPVGATPNAWDSGYMFYQPALEMALRRGVERYPNIDVFLEHEVLGVGDDHGGASVIVRSLADETRHELTARFVVGCDGARSEVRRQLQVEVDDIGFDEPWLVVDVALQRPVDLPDVCLQICDPRRPTTYVPMPEPYRRWEFMLLEGETSEEMEDREQVWSLLEPWLARDDAEIVRAVVYTFHAVIARGWRCGNVMIAGDAAHQMPPFLGQGMCSGIRDAANLAWKLDLVVRGLAPDTLLDTYEEERSPHVRRIIDAAVLFGSMICTVDADVAAARDRQFLDEGFVPPGDSDGLRLPLSAGVVLRDESGAPAAPAGSLFIQPVLTTDDGRTGLLDDLVGPHFTLVSRSSNPEEALTGDAATLWAALDGRAIAGRDDRGFLDAWFDEHECEVVLLRPDRHVFGTAASVSGASDLVSALGRLLAPRP